MLSVVAPTYREAGNIAELAGQVDAALREAGQEYELIIADDYSNDGTDELCAGLAKRFPLILLSRRGERGLSQAVLDGVARARGEVVVVMDADLSHPPECIMQLAKPLLGNDADFALGSRYAAGGALDKKWPWWRRINSLAATWPARLLTPLADPMSGFFAFRRRELPPGLSPIGYKIGLEIAVKMNPPRGRIVEVPIYFRERERGQSKLNWREQINYLRHLRRLFYHRWPKRMEVAQFCAVGFSGMLIDLAVFYGLQFAGAPHLWARALAFWPAVTSNWFLNRVMTFKTRPRTAGLPQWLKFCATSCGGFLCNWGAYALLTTYTEFFAERLLPAFFVGVLAGTVFNFVASDRIVFRRGN